MIASVETLGMQPSWAAVGFAAAAVVLGIVVAIVRDRPTGMSIFAGGVLVAALNLAAFQSPTLPGLSATLGPMFAWFGAAVVLILVAFQGGAGPRDGNQRSKLLHVLVSLLILGGLILGGERPEQISPTAAAIVAVLVAALHPACRFLALVAAVRLVCGLAESTPLYGALLAAGPLLMVGTLVELALRWQFRRRVWLDDPDQLLQTRVIPPWWLAGIWCLAAALAVGFLGFGLSILGIASLALGTIAVLTFGHLAQSHATGEAGLTLAAGTLAAIVVYCVGPAGIFVGAAVAGLWMMWLARFWHQQLLNGVPWTTAGRLISAARRVGVAAAFALAFLVWNSPAPGAVVSAFSLAFSLALFGALAIAARRERCSGSAIGALAAAAGIAILGMRMSPESLPAMVAPPLAATIAALLAGVVAASRNNDGELARAAWIGLGAVTLTGIAISRPEEPQLFVAASITLLSGLLLAGHSRRARTAVDSQS